MTDPLTALAALDGLRRLQGVEPMRQLRIVLLITTAGILAFIVYADLTYAPAYRGNWLVTIIFLPGFLALNLIYLWFSAQTVLLPGRMSRLFSLWVEVKEAELRKRASKNTSAPGDKI